MGIRPPTDLRVTWPPPLPPPAGDYPYFESLRAKASCVYANAMRSQAALDSMKTGAVAKTKLPILYDPIQDAARVRIDPSGVTPGGGSTRSQQKWAKFNLNHTSAFLTWDFRFDEGWRYDPALTAIGRHKTWWVSQNESEAWVLPVTDYRYAQGPASSSQTDIAELVLTVPMPRWLTDKATQVGKEEALQPVVSRFFIEPHIWTRYWIYVEGALGGGAPSDGGSAEVVYLSSWAADENRDPVKLHDRVPLYSSLKGITTFRFAYDTSYYGSTQGLMQSWNRNFVVLAGINAADVPALLQRP